ncbi:MAG: hypothetical protein EON54_07275 [Alcaligenaceae bacterium]|nr:MAG: hypothetical protein EON54_07275 [Alcaligenaceae bacterium]
MSIAEVASLMTLRRIHLVPMMQDNRLVGIVTSSALMKVVPSNTPVVPGVSEIEMVSTLSWRFVSQS